MSSDRNFKLVFLSLLLLAVGIVLNGCAPLLLSMLLQIGHETKDSTWSPQKVALSCTDPSQCPDHQGILFGYRKSGNYYETTRCTASLYDSKHIVTAGHCRMEDAEEIFFLPVPDRNGSHPLVKVHYLESLTR